MGYLGLVIMALCASLIIGILKAVQHVSKASPIVTVRKIFVLDPGTGLANDFTMRTRLSTPASLDPPGPSAPILSTTTTGLKKGLHRRVAHSRAALPPTLELPGGGYQCNVM